jgi:hypothetical protein
MSFPFKVTLVGLAAIHESGPQPTTEGSLRFHERELSVSK